MMIDVEVSFHAPSASISPREITFYSWVHLDPYFNESKARNWEYWVCSSFLPAVRHQCFDASHKPKNPSNVYFIYLRNQREAWESDPVPSDPQMVIRWEHPNIKVENTTPRAFRNNSYHCRTKVIKLEVRDKVRLGFDRDTRACTRLHTLHNGATRFLRTRRNASRLILTITHSLALTFYRTFPCDTTLTTP